MPSCIAGLAEAFVGSAAVAQGSDDGGDASALDFLGAAAVVEACTSRVD